MRITDLLHRESIALSGAPADKYAAIDQMIALMANSGNLNDVDRYKETVLAREAQGTTGIGEGIAIPHGKTGAVTTAGLSAMVVPDGMDFDSLDGAPTYLIFLIAAPDTADNVHLEVLSRLSTILMDEAFRQKLIDAPDVDAFLSLIDAAEKENFDAPAQAVVQPNTQAAEQQGLRILAVTACPTGIAHTYMAAESLEKTAKEMGVTIKVETNGSGGVKNQLTQEEIAQAECIIIAADRDVPTRRFDGKRVIQTKVADGIHRPKELLEQALSGHAPVFHAEGGAQEQVAQEHESVGRRIYKHLMNGVSHMLPFVIGGGILIALAFLFDDFTIDPSNFGSNLPFARFLKTVGDTAFGFMLPVLAGYIAMSIADRPALMVGFVGGMLAKDGGSGFLGALVAGFVAGYLILALRKLFDKLPHALEGTKPVLLYPFFGVLLIGAAMTFLINPPMSAFNTWLSRSLSAMGESSKILLGLILGGMMSIDFGGPLNKAAYVFGTAAIESGNYDIMAAVMIGGMVPPLAIALATLLFKSRFTRSERQSGLTNIVMGLAFITEGAIPFAAADPLRVIPSCAIGSAVAGMLSMVFGCTLMAPHGGVFVFPVVGNALMYIVALLAGTVVGALLLGILKRPVKESSPHA